MQLLLLLLLLLFCGCHCQLQNADHAGRASVKLTTDGGAGAASGLASGLVITPDQAFARIRVSAAAAAAGDDAAAAAVVVPAPGPRQLRSRKLMKLLGGWGPDAAWLSVAKPDQSHSNNAAPPIGNEQDSSNRATAEAAARKLLAGGLNSTDLVAAAGAWLLRLAACQSRSAWTDLGPLIWPRWSRRVECAAAADDAAAGGGCGWPPVMQCQPAGRRTLRMLRWRCDRRPPQLQPPPAPTPRSGRRRNKNGRRRSGRKRRGKRRGRKNAKGIRLRRTDADAAAAAAMRLAGRAWPEKRSRRLAMRLSQPVGSDLLCYWGPHEHRVTDACVCGCASGGGNL